MLSPVEAEVFQTLWSKVGRTRSLDRVSFACKRLLGLIKRVILTLTSSFLVWNERPVGALFQTKNELFIWGSKPQIKRKAPLRAAKKNFIWTKKWTLLCTIFLIFRYNFSTKKFYIGGGRYVDL